MPAAYRAPYPSSSSALHSSAPIVSAGMSSIAVDARSASGNACHNRSRSVMHSCATVSTTVSLGCSPWRIAAAGPAHRQSKMTGTSGSTCARYFTHSRAMISSP